MAQTFAPVSIPVTFELELSPSTWTDVSADVRIRPAPRWSYGIVGAGPLALVGGTGRISLSLDNSANNSAATEGYYSPDHGSARSGFALGIGLRVKIVYGGVTTYKKFYVSGITPSANPGQTRDTRIEGVDWFDEAARSKPQDLAPQVDQRGDELVATIVAAMDNAPDSTDYDMGHYTYAYALDQVESEKASVRTLFTRIARSSLDRIYLTRNATNGETLRFEDHSYREGDVANAFNFDNDLTIVDMARDLRRVINHADVAGPLREVDDELVVLAAINADNPLVVNAGETVTVVLEYRDPDQEASRISGINMQTPLEGTDWVADDGAGADRTSDISVVATFGSTSVELAVTETGGTTAAIVTVLQVRGYGVKTYGQQHWRAQDGTGDRLISLTMPYQSLAPVLEAVAAWIVARYKDAETDVSRIAYWANRADALADEAVALDVGDRIGIDDTLLGLSDADGSGFWIQSVEMEYIEGVALLVSYGLAPAPDLSGTFTLDTSALDGADTLGYF